MKKFALTIGIIFVISVIAFVGTRYTSDTASDMPVNPSPVQPTVIINGITYKVEIADTPESQQHGLSDRASLPQDHGMLFIFPDKQIRQFWMKDMHFPLDIIWIAGDTIVDLSENVPPPAQGEQPAIVYPKAQVDRVLEVNAGEVKKYNFGIGQAIVAN